MTNRENGTHGTTYRNIVLTVICGLLVLLAMRETGPMTGGVAVAADVPNVPNAAAQRVQMIEQLKELKTITAKLTSIEQIVDSRLGLIESTMAEQTAAMRAEQKQRGKEGKAE